MLSKNKLGSLAINNRLNSLSSDKLYSFIKNSTCSERTPNNINSDLNSDMKSRFNNHAVTDVDVMPDSVRDNKSLPLDVTSTSSGNARPNQSTASHEHVECRKIKGPVQSSLHCDTDNQFPCREIASILNPDQVSCTQDSIQAVSDNLEQSQNKANRVTNTTSKTNQINEVFNNNKVDKDRHNIKITHSNLTMRPVSQHNSYRSVTIDQLPGKALFCHKQNKISK